MDVKFLEAQRHVQNQTSVVADYLSDLGEWLVLSKDGSQEHPSGATHVEQLKHSANEHFRKRKYVDACATYSDAILVKPSAVLYSNRAMCYWHLSRYEECYQDCKSSLKIKCSLKALYRKSMAAVKLAKWDSAQADTHRCLSLCREIPEHSKLCTELEHQLTLINEAVNKLRNEQVAHARVQLCTTVPLWCRDRKTRSNLTFLSIHGILPPTMTDPPPIRAATESFVPKSEKYVPRSVRMKSQQRNIA